MKRLFICICIGLLLLPAAAIADQDQSEIEQLRRTIEEQNRIIQELQRRVEAVEATQEDQSEFIESEGDTPLWWEKVKIDGDLRYRHEYIDQDGKDARHRERVKARLGVDAEVHDDLDLRFQIGTGSEVEGPGGNGGDPVSDNQTLTDAFTGKNIWWLEAYFDYHPHQVEGLHLMGGKIKRPFITPGKSELIWDSDVNPEGGVVTFEREFDPVTLMANGYGFWVQEHSSNNPDDVYMLGAQGAVQYDFNAFNDTGIEVLAGLGYFDYENIEDEAGAFFGDDELVTNLVSLGPPPVFETSEEFVGDFFGNTSENGLYAEDFNLFEVFGSVKFDVRDLPITVFADFVNNTAADSSEDTGWSVGVQTKYDKWSFRYLYKEVEKDAVLGVFTDSDFGGGGTNVDGHEINLAYQLTKYTTLGASVFFNNIGIASGDDEKDFQRVQLDVQYKF